MTVPSAQGTEEHVMAVPLGERAFQTTLEDYLFDAGERVREQVLDARVEGGP